MNENKKVVINIDGGSRGNPGEGAIGAVFSDDQDRVIKKYSQAIGVCTNNEAEYQALIFALKKAKAFFGKEKIKNTIIEVRSDSELLVSQQQGRYKIKEPDLQKLFIDVWNLRTDFVKVDFVLIPREQNTKADRLVNQELDSQGKINPLF